MRELTETEMTITHAGLTNASRIVYFGCTGLAVGLFGGFTIGYAAGAISNESTSQKWTLGCLGLLIGIPVGMSAGVALATMINAAKYGLEYTPLA